MSLTRSDIGNMMIQMLARSLESPTTSLQVAYFIDMVREQIRTSNVSPELQRQYHQIAVEILNEWYRSGLIVFSTYDGHQGFPFITVTNFGERCIYEGSAIPYDPDGYIEHFKAEVPQVDDLTLAYISESIATYNLGKLLSATITLGAASENIILSLIEVYTDALQDQDARDKFKRSISRVGIYKKFELFKEEIDSRKRSIPAHLWQDFLPELEAVFNFIRINRNAAGHPSGQAITKTVLAANFQIFAAYSKKLFDLMDYLRANPVL